MRRQLIANVFLKGLDPKSFESPPAVHWVAVIEPGDGYRIRKLRYEGFPGMWISALLYEPTQPTGLCPAVLNPNGHEGAGNALAYKQARCINLAKRGMLALSFEFIGMGELGVDWDHNKFAHMDLCGVAGVSPFYLAMRRGLDVLCMHPRCDPRRVAMTGLSGGGWQTVILAALDDRITAVVPVAGHSPIWQRVSCLRDIGDFEQVPPDLGAIADYDTLTAMMAPRPLLLIYNLSDTCCFRSRRTRRSIYEPVKPFYALMGAGDDVAFYENHIPGTHNYEARSRAQLYAFLNRCFGIQSPVVDLHNDNEILSREALAVGLPTRNQTLKSITSRLLRERPSRAKTRDPLRLRRDLAKQLRLPLLAVIRERLKGQPARGTLQLGADWSLPVTVLAPAGGGADCLVVGDNGRQSLAASVSPMLPAGSGVVVADIFSTGELSLPARYSMLLACVGERPLGIMAAQILALLNWMDSRRAIAIEAHGPITGVAALCAAALRPRRVRSVAITGGLRSLKQLIRDSVAYEEAAPLFCFGLLEMIDIPELVALADGVPVTWRSAVATTD